MIDSKSPWVSVVNAPPDLALPLICDSPHSGTVYPDDFGHALPRARLRQGEDTDVEQLWGHAPAVGATLIAAQFPRTYIDPNRPLCDLDAAMLADPWPDPLAPSPKSALGIGLIWRQVGPGEPIYDRTLTAAEVRHRIVSCWTPYAAAVCDATDRAYARWGCCWHLNLHSMPHNAYERLGIASPTPLADVVLGDRSGQSCGPDFVAMVREALTALGYRVAINDPFQGQDLLRRTGRPDAGRHSLQIEVNRSLYMDEATRVRTAGFETLRRDLSDVLVTIARYVRTATRQRTMRGTPGGNDHD